MSKKPPQQKMSPTTEVSYFISALREIGACSDALTIVRDYGGLESLYSGWERPDFALWFVTRLLGKKITVSLIRKAVNMYLEGTWNPERKKMAGKPLHAIMKAAREWKDSSIQETRIFAELELFFSNTPSKSYRAAVIASALAYEVVEPEGPHTDSAGMTALMVQIRRAVPKARFLTIARQMIAKEVKAQEDPCV